MTADPQAELLVPPLRFTQLQPTLYRGAYPREINFRFLKRLQLKTIVALTPDPITEETDPHYCKFIKDNNITVVHIECAPEGGGKRKKREAPMDYAVVVRALELMIDLDTAPLYIHCLNGGQVSSLVIACLRKLSFWSSVSIFSEFLVYTNTINLHDRTFVENFRAEINVPTNTVPWIWSGLSKDVVGSHPTLTFVHKHERKYSDVGV